MTPLEWAQALIQKPSVTPEDAGCQTLIAKHLQPLGFEIHTYPKNHVQNMFACHGNEGPLFLFLGHTDVVPPGPLEAWRHPPFDAVVENGILFGRGACDMKGAVAAFLSAVTHFLKQTPKLSYRIGILLTSDEEGPALDGTRHVVSLLKDMECVPDYCLVGEPTSQKSIGDTIKVGRRGSLTGTLTLNGTQGHTAYPHQANNPIAHGTRWLHALFEHVWDTTPAPHFPHTTFQCANIKAGTSAKNVIPEKLTLTFNIRFSPHHTEESLKNTLQAYAKQHLECAYDFSFEPTSQPFASEHGQLIQSCCEVIMDITGKSPTLSTEGGTSDGRFLAPLGTEVVELGLVSQTLHQIDEHIAINTLSQLATLYEALLQKLNKASFHGEA